MRTAAIILPTYNESKNIESMLKRIFDVATSIKNWEVHVVVVDSDSPDGTAQLVEKQMNRYPTLHILKTKKEGLGKAYIEGFRTAIEKIKPYVLFEMDADHSHNPSDLPRFLEKIEKGADFVVGSRYIKNGSIPKDWGLDRKLYSICANFIIRFGFMKLRVTDWTNGYRAIRVWVVEKAIHNLQDYTGYVFQVALLDNAIKAGAQIDEIPIHFVDRTEGVSKINSIQYIIQTFVYVFTHSQFIKFAMVGGSGFIIDFTISHIFIDILHKPVWLSTLISAECAIISNFILNNYWSFAHKKLQGSVITSFAKFNSIALGSITMQTVLMQICSLIFGRAYWPVYKFFIIMLVIIPYSYFFYNKFVWKDK